VADRVGALIAAAGKGARFGEPKAFVKLAGHPILYYSVVVFESCEKVDEIILVLDVQDLERGRQLVNEAGWQKVSAICKGGDQRYQSVAAGLASLGQCDWVIIHDGARPLVTEELIVRGLEEAHKTGAAVAAVPAVDTIKVVDPQGTVVGTPPRASLWAVQTPQVFRYHIIAEAYRDAHEFATDDATLVEEKGQTVRIYMGSYENIKITRPEDLKIAEFLLRVRQGG